MDKQVILRINGEPVRLNAFVQKAFAGAVSGLVASLSDLPAEISRIELVIDNRTQEGKQ